MPVLQVVAFKQPPNYLPQRWYSLRAINATMKGEYPITIGTGFSVADVILSREEINYTGLDEPDLMFILSEDGLNKVKGRIKDNTKLIIDKKLADKGLPNAEVHDFFPSGR